MGGLKLGKEAAEKYALAQKDPDLEGMLEKKGAKRKNWTKRWIVLKENYLFYTKKQGESPQGIINLHGATITETQGPSFVPYSFSLLVPKSVSVDAKWTNRTFFMKASSSEEVKKWTTAMVKASHYKAKSSKGKEEPSKTEEKKPEEKLEQKMGEVKIEEKAPETKPEEKKEEKEEKAQLDLPVEPRKEDAEMKEEVRVPTGELSDSESSGEEKKD